MICSAGLSKAVMIPCEKSLSAMSLIMLNHEAIVVARAMAFVA